MIGLPAKNHLNIVHRDIRVTAGGFRLVQHLPRSGADGFAQAIIRRYGEWPGYWPGTDQTYRRFRSVAGIHPLYHRSQIHLAPRLALTVFTPPRPDHSSIAGIATPEQSLRKWQPPIETRVVQRLVRKNGLTQLLVRQLQAREAAGQTGMLIQHLSTQERFRTTALEQLFHPLLTHRQRITVQEAMKGSLSRPGSEQAMDIDSGKKQTRSPQIFLAPPIPRVVRRSAVATTTEKVEDDRPGRIQPGTSPATVPDQRSQAEWGAMGLNHLTDQIIQAIDRRIIAQRERLGRI